MEKPVLIALVVVSEAMLHYFRWREVLQGRELPRVMAYALGVLGLMVPFTWWMLLNDGLTRGEVIHTLWSVIVFGGLAVVSCYALDWVVDAIWKIREAGQREKAIKETIHATEKRED